MPASEWRWVIYEPVEPPSALYTTLRRVGLVDPGTGANWQALEDRGLCRCRYPRDVIGVQLLQRFAQQLSFDATTSRASECVGTNCRLQTAIIAQPSAGTNKRSNSYDHHLAMA